MTVSYTTTTTRRRKKKKSSKTLSQYLIVVLVPSLVKADNKLLIQTISANKLNPSLAQ